MSFVSFKHILCKTYADPTGGRVSFLTPAGVVSGVPTSETTPRFKQADADFTKVMGYSSSTRVPDDGFVSLKDVTIQFAQGNLVKVDSLILFTGSVVGVIS